MVKDVSLEIARKEIFALLGSSGCGKSTLLRMLAGLETPSAGRIVLDGEDPATVQPYRRPTNMMFQSYALFPHLTVEDNVAFGLRQERPRIARGDIAARVGRMLELVQMQKYARRKPHELSGGQQRRVARAQPRQGAQAAAARRATGGARQEDPPGDQLELVHLIERVGVTCIIVTHDRKRR